MGTEKPDRSRRAVLRLAGIASFAGVAGCLGDDTDETEADDSDQPFSPEWYGDMDTALPESQETCTSIEGVERDPEGLNAKEDVDYQFHPNYSESPNWEDDPTEMCANCRFFCPSTGDNPDLPQMIGACTEVEGGIRSQDWCALWQPVEGLSEE